MQPKAKIKIYNFTFSAPGLFNMNRNKLSIMMSMNELKLI